MWSKGIINLNKIILLCRFILKIHTTSSRHIGQFFLCFTHWLRHFWWKTCLQFNLGIFVSTLTKNSLFRIMVWHIAHSFPPAVFRNLNFFFSSFTLPASSLIRRSWVKMQLPRNVVQSHWRIPQESPMNVLQLRINHYFIK